MQRHGSKLGPVQEPAADALPAVSRVDPALLAHLMDLTSGAAGGKTAVADHNVAIMDAGGPARIVAARVTEGLQEIFLPENVPRLVRFLDRRQQHRAGRHIPRLDRPPAQSPAAAHGAKYSEQEQVIANRLPIRGALPHRRTRARPVNALQRMTGTTCASRGRDAS